MITKKDYILFANAVAKLDNPEKGVVEEFLVKFFKNNYSNFDEEKFRKEVKNDRA